MVDADLADPVFQNALGIALMPSAGAIVQQRCGERTPGKPGVQRRLLQGAVSPAEHDTGSQELPWASKVGRQTFRWEPDMTKAKLFCGAAALAFVAALASPSASLAAEGGGHMGGGAHFSHFSGGGHVGGGMHMSGGMHNMGAMHAASPRAAFAAPGAQVSSGSRTAFAGGRDHDRGFRGDRDRDFHHRGFGGFGAGFLAGSALGYGYGYGYPYDYDDSYAYYGGPDYYYDEGPSVGVSIGVGGDAVAYCEQRYRSYDPASGTYLGYDGLRHPCP